MTWSPSDVAVLVPVLGRPHLVEPFMESLGRTVTLAVDGVVVYFIASERDHDELEALEDAGVNYTVWPGQDTYPQKLNMAWHHTSRRYLFCTGDDVVFREGWLEAVMQVMSDQWMSSADTQVPYVVGTLDKLTANVMAGEHATHYMVDRFYLEDVGGVIDQGPGSFLNAMYRHNYVDNEFIGTAQHRGVYAPSTGVVEHAHHLSGAAMYDDTYRLGDESKAADAHVFESRRHLWA